MQNENVGSQPEVRKSIYFPQAHCSNPGRETTPGGCSLQARPKGWTAAAGREAGQSLGARDQGADHPSQGGRRRLEEKL